jgi:hypothetical protein
MSMLGADGLTQWREVFGSVERHMAGQQEIFAGLSVGLLVLVVFIADVYLARRLLRRRGAKTGARRP